MLKNGQNVSSIRLPNFSNCGSARISDRSRSAHLRCTELIELFETNVWVERYLRWKFRRYQEQVPRLRKGSTKGSRWTLTKNG